MSVNQGKEHTMSNTDNTDKSRCPATGRSAIACTDQITHAACWAGRQESIELDRKVEQEFRRIDWSY